MDKSLIDVVNDFSRWRGDTYRLAALIAAHQKEQDAPALDDAGFTEAAEVVRSA